MKFEEICKIILFIYNYVFKRVYRIIRRIKAMKNYLVRFIRRFLYCFKWKHLRKRENLPECERCGSFRWVFFDLTDERKTQIFGKEGSPLFCLNCVLEEAYNKGIMIQKSDFTFLRLRNDYDEDVKIL
jgi:hypothetical protein